MLTNYIRGALSRAEFERLEDGTYGGAIPGFAGLATVGDTIDECRENLQDALEGWLVLSLRHDHQLPAIDGEDLSLQVEEEVVLDEA